MSHIWMRFRKASVAAALALASFSAIKSWAVDSTWTNTSGGLFYCPRNWSAGVPGLLGECTPDLFDFGALTRRFDTLTRPALESHLAWSTADLDRPGSISVVPEPAGLEKLEAG